MKKALLNGKIEAMDIGDNVSPKKGNKHMLGKANIGFSDFTTEMSKGSGSSTPQKKDEKKNSVAMKKSPLKK